MNHPLRSLVVILVFLGCCRASLADGTTATTRESAFKLTSPVVSDGGALPREFTGDGESASPPLEWTGAPAGTKSFALIMHHVPGPGDVKWYWILYNIPADVHSLAKNARGIGTFGNNSVNGQTEYAPPHSKGPGAKTYILTLYALSDAAQPSVPASQVDRATLLAAIKDRTLASAELKVTYDRTDVIAGKGGEEQTGPNAGGAGAGSVGAGGGPAPGAHLIPREAEQKLHLTPDQQQQIQALEKETQAKLAKILTPEQLKILQNTRPPRRGDQSQSPPP
jgi:phosphatidylethanolamine-binding protein (PEBP) family uncharacterized protein